jgi:DNA-binding transcriptional ArsR family regulator
MAVKESNDLFELHADFCKAIASATRLRIVALLRDGEQAVGKLAEATGSSLANISQHLRILRSHDIVRTRKDGRVVYCRLRDPRLVGACELTRSILLGAMKERGALGSRSEASLRRLSRKLAPEAGAFSAAPSQLSSRNGSEPRSVARTSGSPDSLHGSSRSKTRKENRS